VMAVAVRSLLRSRSSRRRAPRLASSLSRAGPGSRKFLAPTTRRRGSIWHLPRAVPVPPDHDLAADASRRRVSLETCGRYIFVSLCNVAFVRREMRSPSGAWSSTESKEVGWEVITNAPMGTASRSRLIGWVVYMVYGGAIRMGDAGGSGGGVLGFFLMGGLLILYSCIAGLPLGRDRTISSESHAAFHVTSKGVSRMGVSSSSGRIRVRCSGVKPL
jgi:hypothetical protein